MDAIRVTVRRGDVVEAVHRVHFRSSGGDGAGEDVHCFLRSALKPLQAIPLLESVGDLDDDELAIAAASHRAEPAQLAAVRKLLDRSGSTVDDLELGVQFGRGGKLEHNCSGKHAGMLAACRASGWPTRSYSAPEHPLQRRIAELVGAADVGIDGCGVPTYAMRLSEMCELFLRIPPRVATAMRAHPELVGGTGAEDTALMHARPALVAKYGAEALLCISDGETSWAFKVEDGGRRALVPAVASVLGIDELRTAEVRNSLGEVVGSIV